jgi:ADP-ribose pyrophosphatase YjhB (NUDIX family)
VRAILRPGYRVAARIRDVYWFVFRPRTFGVKCAIEHDGHWLMIRNTYGRRHWTFPGGKVERGEHPREAALREVREEVGIVLDDVRPVGDYYTTKQYKRDTVYCFTATVRSRDHAIDPGEIAEAKWVRIGELPDFRSHAVDRITSMLEQRAAAERSRRQG